MSLRVLFDVMALGPQWNIQQLVGADAECQGEPAEQVDADIALGASDAADIGAVQAARLRELFL